MEIIIQFLLAMVATITFAILFCAPKSELLLCSISGAIGWIVYYIINNATDSVVIGSFIATLVLTVYSRAVAVIRQCPGTTYLIPGIFPLVPGAGLYYTVYYMIVSQRERSFSKGIETLGIAIAIVFGIIFGSAIPQAFFAKLSRRNKKA